MKDAIAELVSKREIKAKEIQERKADGITKHFDAVIYLTYKECIQDVRNVLLSNQ